MKETLHHLPERSQQSHEEAHQHEHEPLTAEQGEDLDSGKSVEAARLAVEEHAISGEQTHQAQPDEPKRKELFISKDVRRMTYQRTIKRLRKNLSPLGRFGSKVIHQPAVEAVSEAASKTVGRPSGLLGGGLVAFIGSVGYYYMTRHYNYSYNFTVFFVLLVGGFAVGWFLEFFFKSLRGHK